MIDKECLSSAYFPGASFARLTSDQITELAMIIKMVDRVRSILSSWVDH